MATSSNVYCFSVHAEASPSALPRVVEVFALHGHVPSRCHARLDGADGETAELVVDLQMAGISAQDAALIAKRLGRCVAVRDVLWSEKRAAA
jgi:hypothetical protein